jgi:hypothetical protein
MLEKLVQRVGTIRSELRVPPRARAEQWMDLRGELADDPGVERAVDSAVTWLCRAQDCSRSRDGGVARHFSLLDGWSASYPETTGYIVPTVLHCARDRGDERLRARARTMVDWLVSIQLPDGGFQAGTIGAPAPIVPAIFNTGQILLGLASAVHEWGEQYRAPMRRAAAWLVATQDSDGAWRNFQSPFVAVAGDKTYYTHVAWGLLEAGRLEPDAPYAEAALANARWALGHQRPNGWFENCCVDDLESPLTHTLGYVLRGLVEAYRFSDDENLLHACRQTADGLLGALRSDGFLPGRLGADWRGTVGWSCLTGTAQIACCWLLLYQFTGDARYREAAYAANRYVRRTVRLSGNADARGAVKGSHPISGGYGRFEYLAWAAKFFIDSNLLERTVRGR